MGWGSTGRKKTRKRRASSIGAVFAADILRVVVVLVLLQIFVFQFSLVRGSSMLPNIHDGDRLVVDKLSYSLHDVERFDVVILAYPRNPDVDYVKRVVGMPGDLIDIRGGRVHVNGRQLPEPFSLVPSRRDEGSWRVPPGQYFVLGDNRPVSSDSREGWFVDRVLIKGKVRACFWPLGSARVF